MYECVCLCMIGENVVCVCGDGLKTTETKKTKKETQKSQRISTIEIRNRL